MPLRTHVFTCALGCLALVGCAAGALTRGAAAESLDKASAAYPEGSSVFERECAGCHGKRGQGAASVPAIMGSGALAEQSDDRPPFASAADVFAYVQREMPLPKNRAGTLSDAEYWSVTAFMLQAHGVALPPGGLSADNAKSVSLP
jgi:cytochrome c